MERQAGKQGLVGVEVVVADTSARVAAAMAAVPDAARRYPAARDAPTYGRSEAVTLALKLACEKYAYRGAHRGGRPG